jgi:hypothetical protein
MSEMLKVLLGALGGAILALLLVGSLSGGGMGYSKMGGGLFSPLFVLLFWALIVTLVAVLVVWIVTQVQRR